MPQSAADRFGQFVIPLADFDAEVEKLVRRITDNSTFSHAANKRLLEATDNDALDAGLAGEVMENEAPAKTCANGFEQRHKAEDNETGADNADLCRPSEAAAGASR